MSDVVQTSSGIPLEPVYGPGDRARDPPPPGDFPFTRGNFATGYRGKTVDVPAVLGLRHRRGVQPRYRYLLGQGGTGLSVALDLPTQCGYDSDDPDVARRSAGSASPSTPWPTPRSSSTASPSTRSAPASPSTAPRRSCWPSTWPPPRSRACPARSSPARSRTTSSRSTPPAAPGSGRRSRRCG